ncbi:MAG: hypothetical protein IKY51_02810 [Alistipes sp.]|nr:hypothetical protein [Alistipes sp.]
MADKRYIRCLRQRLKRAHGRSGWNMCRIDGDVCATASYVANAICSEDEMQR